MPCIGAILFLERTFFTCPMGKIRGNKYDQGIRYLNLYRQIIMKQYLKSIFILLTGLIFFHLFSTLQVYLSNTALLKILKTLKTTDYLLMPNSLIMAKLDDISVAFAGGVFFTLSVGTFIVLVSFGAAVIYYRYEKLKTGLAVVAVSSLLIGFLIINENGLCLVESMSCLLVPLFVFFLYGLLFNTTDNRPDPEMIAVHFIPLIVLASLLIVTTLISKHKIFSDFRDSFLMSNSIGMKVNNFYYKYTLYPARVFKPYSMRLPKVCSVEANSEEKDTFLIKKRLIDMDYLVIDKGHDGALIPDFIIQKNGKDLWLKYKGRTVIKTQVKLFTSKPWQFLKQFSKQTDKYGNYRQITSFALKTGFPFYMYILMHFILYIFFRVILSVFAIKEKNAIAASLCCFVIGSLSFVMMYNGSKFEATKENLISMLKSPITGERIAGLKFVDKKHLDITKFAAYDTRFKDNNIPEKYWYARAIGSSSAPDAYQELVKFLDDSHINVVCQALYGLGQLKKRAAVDLIIKKIETSEDWYVQWYAYRALKRLKWTQRTKYQKKRL